MRKQLRLAALFAVLYAGFFLWQTPGLLGGRLTSPEIEDYMARIDRNLAFAPEEVRGQLLADLRAWAAKDDGGPVNMINLMRYFGALHRNPQIGDFAGTPAEANAFYEKSVMPLLFRRGDYPIYAGNDQGANLLGHEADADNWNRVLVIHYASRRHFLDLLADPAYGPYAPYKFASLTLDLAPTSPDVVLGDLRLIVGLSALSLFLAIAWWRSSRGA